MNNIRTRPHRLPPAAFHLLLLLAALLALSCPTASAAPKPRSVLTFSETWTDKVACTGSNSQGDLACDTVSVGKLTLKAAFSTNDLAAAVDPTQFDQNTTFDISLGNYSFSDTLGDAPGYVAGASKATFLLTNDLCTAADNNNGLPCPSKVYETIALTITPKGLTVSITAKTGTDANGNTFETAIDADTFDGDATGPVTDTLSFQMDLGDLTVFSDVVPVTGTIATKTVTDKAANQDTLSNVKIKGTLPASALGQ